MRTRNFPRAFFTGLVLFGTATTVLAQTDAPEHDAHHPVEAQASPPAAAMPGHKPAAAAPESMPGMGMMTPEMMQMMQRMMGQGGTPDMMGGMPGQGAPEGGAGPSAPGQKPMAGMMTCPMMRTMMNGQAAMGMPGMVGGQGALLGTPLGSPEEMTEDRVRALLEQQLTSLGNPRLKLGEIGTASDRSITAEILTVDGSLVQRLAFNRYPGLVRQIVD